MEAVMVALPHKGGTVVDLRRAGGVAAAADTSSSSSSNKDGSNPRVRVKEVRFHVESSQPAEIRC